MAVATSVLVASAIAAGASAGANLYAAKKQSSSARDAAKTQSDAAVQTAKIQSDSADKIAGIQTGSADRSAQIQADASNRAAALQAASAREALDYSRGQSQLSLDQYNQQQVRLQPYRNLGNFALGLPSEAAPAPLRLPAMQSGGGGQVTQGHMPTVSAANGDIGKQVSDYFAQRGVAPNPSSVGYWAEKWNEFGANDPVYFNQRLAIADEFGGGGSTSAGSPMMTSAAPVARPPVTLGYRPTATPFVARPPRTAPLQTPQLRYRPLSALGTYED